MGERPFQLLLVDEDPVFRWGLRIWLEQAADFAVAAEASTAQEALTSLNASCQADLNQADLDASPSDISIPPALPSIDLVIIDIGLGRSSTDGILGLTLCQEIRQRYAQLPIVVLSAEAAPILQVAALEAGATAFGSRGLPVPRLIQLIRNAIATDQPLVALANPLPQTVSPPPTIPPPSISDTARLIAAPWDTLKRQVRRQGLDQIQAALDSIDRALKRSPTAPTWIILTGRRRELKAAQWLTTRLLAAAEQSESDTPEYAPDDDLKDSVISDRDPGYRLIQEGDLSQPVGKRHINQSTGEATPLGQSDPASDLTIQPVSSLNAGPSDIQALVIEAVFRKLHQPLDNKTDLSLEIDILRADKKRELLYITLRQFEALLDELRHSQVQPGQLSDRASVVLSDLRQGVINDFFGKYYTLSNADGTEQVVVPTLLADAAVVSQTMLNRIPLVPALLGHLLFAEPLTVNGSLQAATSYDALMHSQRLLDNLLIQVACAVVQPLLNHFADVEAFKKRLYQRQMMSSRDIERFRNNLSWRYRWDSAVHHPKAIFESQYRLLVLADGIFLCYVYAPRRSELDTLSGFQYSVTLALEARDAIAPRFRTLVSLLGSGVVYVLTEVVGRGIGLIGRGVLQGIGNAWQESRPKRPRR